MARILDQLVGHRSALAPLLKAAAEGRLASTLLFAGPPGIGKKKAALALAQALVCDRGSAGGGLEPCGECSSCQRLEHGRSEALLVISPDGAQIKIDQAREALRFLFLRQMGRARVVIVDQAHLLNPQAGNALLKALEEPPEGTHFILITPLAAAVLGTLRSRSQFVRFKPLSEGELKRVLGPDVDEWVVAASQGSVETARRLEENQEEYAALEGTVVAYMQGAATGFPTQAISQLKDLTKDRAAQGFVLNLIQGVLVSALRRQAGVESKSWAGSEAGFRDMIEGMSRFEPACLQTLADLSIELEQDLARNVDRALVFENFAIQWRLAAQKR